MLFMHQNMFALYVPVLPPFGMRVDQPIGCSNVVTTIGINPTPRRWIGKMDLGPRVHQCPATLMFFGGSYWRR
jgi:hypothetical protein